MEIVDKDGRRLGEIDANSACSAVDGGIFYSVVEMKEYALTGTARYHFFRTSDGTWLIRMVLRPGEEKLYLWKEK